MKATTTVAVIVASAGLWAALVTSELSGCTALAGKDLPQIASNSYPATVQAITTAKETVDTLAADTTVTKSLT